MTHASRTFTRSCRHRTQRPAMTLYYTIDVRQRAEIHADRPNTVHRRYIGQCMNACALLGCSRGIAMAYISSLQKCMEVQGHRFSQIRQLILKHTTTVISAMMHSPYRTTLAYKTISSLLIGEPGDAMVAACQICSALGADKYQLQEKQFLREDDKSGPSAGRVKPVTFDHSTATTWSDRTRFSHPQIHFRRCRYASHLTLSRCRGCGCSQ